jgi:hypothetical protein
VTVPAFLRTVCPSDPPLFSTIGFRVDSVNERIWGRQIRVSESYHAYLKGKQREDETLGETAERLGRDFSLYEWATEGWDDVDDADREEVAAVLREIDDEDDSAELDDELPT